MSVLEGLGSWEGPLWGGATGAGSRFPCSHSWGFFKRFYLFILEKGEGREKERERNINMWLLFARPLLGYSAHNPGLCPDWELNWQPFGL